MNITAHQQQREGNSVILHDRLRTALSPSSALYAILWPLIIETSEYTFRRNCLLKVNHYLRSLCEKHHNHSDKAKAVYESWSSKHPRLHHPHLDDDLASGEWRYLKVKELKFPDPARHDEFLASGTIDPSTKDPKGLTAYDVRPPSPPPERLANRSYIMRGGCGIGYMIPPLVRTMSSEAGDVVLLGTVFSGGTYREVEIVGEKRKVEAMARFLEMKLKDAKESEALAPVPSYWQPFPTPDVITFDALEFEGREVKGEKFDPTVYLPSFLRQEL